jgi:thiosulfate/3-mercaptopyruvate sulfurtransferase
MSILSRCSSASVGIAALLLTGLSLCQESSNTWRQSELMEPTTLARAIEAGNSPYVICVAFPLLYHAKRIPHAIFAGPGSKPEGLASLKIAASKLPKDELVVIYCGCCPMEKCPNVRPAYALLKDLGFKKIRVLDVPISMHADWFSRGFPSEAGQ